MIIFPHLLPILLNCVSPEKKKEKKNTVQIVLPQVVELNYADFK